MAKIIYTSHTNDCNAKYQKARREVLRFSGTLNSTGSRGAGIQSSSCSSATPPDPLLQLVDLRIDLRKTETSLAQYSLEHIY